MELDSILINHENIDVEYNCNVKEEIFRDPRNYLVLNEVCTRNEIDPTIWTETKKRININKSQKDLTQRDLGIFLNFYLKKD